MIFKAFRIKETEFYLKRSKTLKHKQLINYKSER